MLPLWLLLLITSLVVGLWMSCFLFGCRWMVRRADQLYRSPQRRADQYRRIGASSAPTMPLMAARIPVVPQWPRSSAELTKVG